MEVFKSNGSLKMNWRSQGISPYLFGSIRPSFHRHVNIKLTELNVIFAVRMKH